MPDNKSKVNEAKEILSRIFANTDVQAETTRHDLEEVQEHLEEMLSALPDPA